MKKAICLLLTVVLFVSLAAVPAVASETAEDYVQTLYSLGLFLGTGTDSSGNPIFELERQPSRTEALVMMLRLFGEEKNALEYSGTMPFTDVPAWAEKYVGYAYDKGFTKGVSSTKFDAQSYASENVYVTFMLRALGYSDTDGDFSYDSAADFAIEQGIIDESLRDKTVFTRDDCAKVSYMVLSAKCKDTDTCLLNKLVLLGKLDAEAADASGLLDYDGGRQDYFQYTQSGNVRMGCNAATDGQYIYISKEVELDTPADEEYYKDFYYGLYKFDNEFGGGELIYSSEMYGRITDLSIHNGKLYFLDGSPYSNGTRGPIEDRHFYFVELDPETNETKILYSSGYLWLQGWYDGVFYFYSDPALNKAARNYDDFNLISVDTNQNNKVTVLPRPDCYMQTSAFDEFGGWNGDIYVKCIRVEDGKYNRYFAKWIPETGAIEKICSGIENFLLVGEDLYFTQRDENGKLNDLRRAKVSDLENSEVVCTLPTSAWRYNYHYGVMYCTCDANRVNGNNVVYKIDLQTGSYEKYITSFIDYDYNVMNEYVFTEYSLSIPNVTSLVTGEITPLEEFIGSRVS